MTTVAPKYGVVSGYLNGEFALHGLGSEYNRRLLRGAINLPISEKSALRIAVQAYNNDGFVTDAYNGQPERLTSIALRARYKAELGDSGASSCNPKARRPFSATSP
jgi:iron complex outermembrane receptor protein